ncbi:MAG: aldo/keto reductase [Rhodanobacter sp.]
MPRLAFGGAPIGNLYAGVTEGDAHDAVHRAWQLGIRHFDTAPYYGYGLSEARLGTALASFTRDSYTLSTKVGRLLSDTVLSNASDAHAKPGDGFAVEGRQAVFDYSRDGILRSVEASLQRLQTDRVEILLLHDIGALTHGDNHAAVLRQALDESLPTMAELRTQGVCQAIGLGVNEEAICLQVMPAFELDVIMLAGRYTLFEQHDSAQVMALAIQQGVAVMAAGPYNSGLLSGSHAPGDTYNYAPADADTQAKAQRFYDICAQHGLEVGAVALQFPLAHPAVATVVCGLRSPAEVVSAIQRLDDTIIPASLWIQLREAGLLDPSAVIP